MTDESSVNGKVVQERPAWYFLSLSSRSVVDTCHELASNSGNGDNNEKSNDRA